MLYGHYMERSSTTAGATERRGLRLYATDDDLPPGGVEALKRRSPEELQAAADRVARSR